MQEGIEPLTPFFDSLTVSQQALLETLEQYDSASPDDAGEEVGAAAEAWHADLLKLDRAYGRAWRDLLHRIAALWSNELVPRLSQADSFPHRRVPEWLWLALLAAAALLSGALLVILL